MAAKAQKKRIEILRNFILIYLDAHGVTARYLAEELRDYIDQSVHDEIASRERGVDGTVVALEVLLKHLLQRDDAHWVDYFKYVLQKVDDSDSKKGGSRRLCNIVFLIENMRDTDCPGELVAFLADHIDDILALEPPHPDHDDHKWLQDFLRDHICDWDEAILLLKDRRCLLVFAIFAFGAQDDWPERLAEIALHFDGTCLADEIIDLQKHYVEVIKDKKDVCKKVGDKYTDKCKAKTPTNHADDQSKFLSFLPSPEDDQKISKRYFENENFIELFVKHVIEQLKNQKLNQQSVLSSKMRAQSDGLDKVRRELRQQQSALQDLANRYEVQLKDCELKMNEQERRFDSKMKEQERKHENEMKEREIKMKEQHQRYESKMIEHEKRHEKLENRMIEERKKYEQIVTDGLRKRDEQMANLMTYLTNLVPRVVGPVQEVQCYAVAIQGNQSATCTTYAQTSRTTSMQVNTATQTDMELDSGEPNHTHMYAAHRHELRSMSPMDIPGYSLQGMGQRQPPHNQIPEERSWSSDESQGCSHSNRQTPHCNITSQQSPSVTQRSRTNEIASFSREGFAFVSEDIDAAPQGDHNDVSHEPSSSRDTHLTHMNLLWNQTPEHLRTAALQQSVREQQTPAEIDQMETVDREYQIPGPLNPTSQPVRAQGRLEDRSGFSRPLDEHDEQHNLHLWQMEPRGTAAHQFMPPEQVNDIIMQEAHDNIQQPQPVSNRQVNTDKLKCIMDQTPESGTQRKQTARITPSRQANTDETPLKEVDSSETLLKQVDTSVTQHKQAQQSMPNCKSREQNLALGPQQNWAPSHGPQEQSVSSHRTQEPSALNEQSALMDKPPQQFSSNHEQQQHFSSPGPREPSVVNNQSVLIDGPPQQFSSNHEQQQHFSSPGPQEPFVANNQSILIDGPPQQFSSNHEQQQHFSSPGPQEPFVANNQSILIDGPPQQFSSSHGQQHFSSGPGPQNPSASSHVNSHGSQRNFSNMHGIEEEPASSDTSEQAMYSTRPASQWSYGNSYRSRAPANNQSNHQHHNKPYTPQRKPRRRRRQRRYTDNNYRESHGQWERSYTGSDQFSSGEEQWNQSHQDQHCNERRSHQHQQQDQRRPPFHRRQQGRRRAPYEYSDRSQRCYYGDPFWDPDPDHYHEWWPGHGPGGTWISFQFGPQPCPCFRHTSDRWHRWRRQ